MVELQEDRFYSEAKLYAHMDRLHQWKREGHPSGPVQGYLELTDRCNHDCPGCLGFRDNKSEMSYDEAKRVVREMGELGVRGVLLSGGGEPTFHPQFREVLEYIEENGMQPALITNGQKLPRETIESIVRTCKFVRVSIDADSPETHARTHGVAEWLYPVIMKNVDQLVKRKRETGSGVTIGYSYLFDASSEGRLYTAAKKYKEQGVDYIKFKPFFTPDNEVGEARADIVMDTETSRRIKEELRRAKKELETDSFSVSFPQDRIDHQLGGGEDEDKRVSQGVSKCYVPHFFITVTSKMEAFPCCIIKGRPENSLGNLREKSLREIWGSEKARTIEDHIDLSHCPNPCQFNGHVKLLSEIKRPRKHGNFL